MPPKNKPNPQSLPPVTRNQTLLNPFPTNGHGDANVELSTDNMKMLQIVLEKLDEKLKEFKSEMLSAIIIKDRKINELEERVSDLGLAIQTLEERLEDSEAQHRLDEIILSGDSAVTTGTAEGNLGPTVCKILKDKLNYVIETGVIRSARRLGKPPVNQGPDRRRVIVKLEHRATASDIIRASRTMKPPGLFVNENLITERSRVLYALRQIKRRKPEMLSGCGSLNGRVYAWTKPTDLSQRGRKIYLNTWRKFNSFCSDTLGLNSDELLESLPSQ